MPFFARALTTGSAAPLASTAKVVLIRRAAVNLGAKVSGSNAVPPPLGPLGPPGPPGPLGLSPPAGAGLAAIVVGSLAPSFAVFSPARVTVAVLTTLAGASPATSTVTVIGG